jgi:hypothetical protein
MSDAKTGDAREVYAIYKETPRAERQGYLESCDHLAAWVAAAGAGVAEACFLAGKCHAEGILTTQDAAAGFRFYKAGAELGEVYCQANLATLYEAGTACSVDLAETHRWRTAAAAQGSAASMHNLGLNYEYGKGVETDLQMAIEWFARSGEAGMVEGRDHAVRLLTRSDAPIADLERALAILEGAEKTDEVDALKGRLEMARLPPAQRSTLKVLKSIEDLDLAEDIVWDEVEITRVLAALEARDEPLGLNLYSDVPDFALNLAHQVLRQAPERYVAFLETIGPNFFVSCWGGPMWSPRVMWDGGILVRNHHRVQGVNFAGFVRIDDMDGLIADLEKIREGVPALFPDPDVHYYYLWMLNAVGDEIVSDLDFSRVDRAGNCLVGIGSTDLLAACDVLTPEIFGDTIDISRGGMVLRLFEGGVSAYTTGRWADSLDYVTDNMWLGQYDYSDTEDPIATGESNNVHALLSDLCVMPRRYSSEDWETVKTRKQDFFREKLEDPWSEEVLYAFNVPEEVQTRLQAADGVPGAETSALDLLFDRTIAHMSENFREYSGSSIPLFGGAEGCTSGYVRASADAEETRAWQADPRNPVAIRLSPFNWSSLSDLLAFESPAPLLAMAEAAGFVADGGQVEIRLPALGDLEELWRPLDRAGLDAFAQRLLPYLVSYDSDESEALTAAMARFAGTTLSDSGALLDAQGQDVPFELEGGCVWEDWVGEFTESEFLRVRCDLPGGRLLDLLELGKRIGLGLDAGLKSPSGAALGLSTYINVTLPMFGLSQGFDGEIVDSGNIEKW